MPSPQELAAAALAAQGQRLPWSSPGMPAVRQAPAATPLFVDAAKMDGAQLPAPVAQPSPAQTARDALDAYERATQQRIAAVTEGGASQAAAVEQASASSPAQAAELRASVDRRREAQSAYDRERARIQAEQAGVDAQMSQVRDRRSIGQKILGAIAIAVGGGAPLYQSIMRSVEADMQRQQEALKSKSAMKREELQAARQYFQDDAQAEEYTTATLMQAHAAELEGQAAKMKAGALRDQALATAAQIGEQAAEQKLAVMARQEERAAELGERRSEREAATREHARDRAAASGRRADKDREVDWGKVPPHVLEAMAADRTLPADGYKALEVARSTEARADERGNRVASRAIGGLDATKPLAQITDVDANKAQAAKTIHDGLVRNIAELRRLATQDSGFTARDRYALLKEQTTAMLTQAAGSGVPGAQEAARIAVGLPGPNLVTQWSLSDRGAVYDAALDTIDSMLRSSVEPYGYSVARRPVGGSADESAEARNARLGIRKKGATSGATGSW